MKFLLTLGAGVVLGIAIFYVAMMVTFYRGPRP